jgi:hypothetical protein
MAAEGLGELVGVTSEEALRPFVVQITGPLIRIIGDRFPPATKAAILATLGLLISRAGAGLKPFVPQLQTTFLKCLNDAAPEVRAPGAPARPQRTQPQPLPGASWPGASRPPHPPTRRTPPRPPSHCRCGGAPPTTSAI